MQVAGAVGGAEDRSTSEHCGPGRWRNQLQPETLVKRRLAGEPCLRPYDSPPSARSAARCSGGPVSQTSAAPALPRMPAGRRARLRGGSPTKTAPRRHLAEAGPPRPAPTRRSCRWPQRSRSRPPPARSDRPTRPASDRPEQLDLVLGEMEAQMRTSRAEFTPSKTVSLALARSRRPQPLAAVAGPMPGRVARPPTRQRRSGRPPCPRRDRS